MDCAGSHLRGSCAGPATLRCGSCGAVRYCSREHQRAHWGEHGAVCSRMAEQMQRAPELYDFPFSFTLETSLSPDSMCSLLGAAGWSFPASFCPCTSPEHALTRSLRSWEEYYTWRGIPFHSPAALLLHWPLSVYHAVQLAQLRTVSPELEKTLNIEAPLNVHYLGPAIELDQLPVFGELLALFPSVEIYIDFVGPAVPESRDGERSVFSTFACCGDGECACKKRESVPKGGVTTRLWRGLYHERYSEMGGTPPDLVFAANAGIAAFSSWRPSIELMASLSAPALVTDYCEEAAVLAVETIQYVTGSLVSYPVQVNPFRQPLSPRHKHLDLPTFSNAFIFGFHGPASNDQTKH